MKASLAREICDHNDIENNVNACKKYIMKQVLHKAENGQRILSIYVSERFGNEIMNWLESLGYNVLIKNDVLTIDWTNPNA